MSSMVFNGKAKENKILDSLLMPATTLHMASCHVARHAMPLPTRLLIKRIDLQESDTVFTLFQSFYIEKSQNKVFEDTRTLQKSQKTWARHPAGEMQLPFTWKD